MSETVSSQTAPDPSRPAAGAPKLVAKTKCFGGWIETHEHLSAACNAPMRFAVYLPPQAESGPVPWLLWLSGLTCTEENFMAKAGAQRLAAAHGLALVVPDTSPRGLGLPGEAESYDFGTGAGFYVDATQAPYSDHYRMFSYVADELPELVCAHFPLDPDRAAIFGHSMGGHGALVVGAHRPERFKAISAFAPIGAPMQVPWGEKAFAGYLGADPESWRAYDASELIRAGRMPHPLLIDQGTDDQFLTEQLRPELLEAACAVAGTELTLRRQDGYDHSYHFIATFIADHFDWHARALGIG